MKVSKADSSNLIIKDMPLYPGIVFLPWSVFGFYKLVEHLSRSLNPDRELFGALASAVMPLIAVGLMNEFVRFHFNIGERTLYWKRTGLFGRKGGTIFFSDIRNVVIETSHSRFSTTYRLAIKTNEGSIPMTRCFRAGEQYKKELESIAELIDNALGREGRDHRRFIEDSILELVAAGRRIDAVRLVREHYKFGLTEAKRFIDELSSKPENGVP